MTHCAALCPTIEEASGVKFRSHQMCDVARSIPADRIIMILANLRVDVFLRHRSRYVFFHTCGLRGP